MRHDAAGAPETVELIDKFTRYGGAPGSIMYLAAKPLQPVTTPTSIRVGDGGRVVTEGPFAETREQLGGYFLIEANAVAEQIPGARKGTSKSDVLSRSWVSLSSGTG